MYDTQSHLTEIRRPGHPNKASLILLGVSLCFFCVSSTTSRTIGNTIQATGPLPSTASTPQLVSREQTVPERSSNREFVEQEAAALTAPAVFTPGKDRAAWFSPNPSATFAFAAVGAATAVATIVLNFYLKAVVPKYEAKQQSTEAATARTLNLFEKAAGLDPYEEADLEAFIERPKLLQELTEFLRPKTTGMFGVVVDVSGCGKSTAIRKAIRALNPAGGVIYFDTPASPQNFVADLAAMLDFYGVPIYLKTRLQDRKETNIVAWSLLRSILEKAAVDYKAKTLALVGTTVFTTPEARAEAVAASLPVLVVDSVEELAKQDPAFLEVLQNFAKKCADKRSLRVIFVGSGGDTLPFLESFTSFSRGLRFGSDYLDISDAEGVRYLVHNGLDEDLAKELVKDITGGRLAWLEKAYQFQVNRPIEELRGEFMNGLGKVLSDCGVSPDNELFLKFLQPRSPPSAVVKIALPTARKLVPKGAVQKLLQANILSQVPGKQLVIHSRYVETYLHECNSGKSLLI